MSYFAKLPNTMFEFNGVSYLVKDITRRSKFINNIKQYTGLYEIYEIADEDTIEALAERYYGNASSYWVIMIFNELHNLYFEWPMGQTTLAAYVEDKYGSAANNIKHWELDGYIIGEAKEFVSADTWVSPVNPLLNNPTVVPKTFYEHEVELNDAKRNIKIMRVELLADFIQQFTKSFK